MPEIIGILPLVLLFFAALLPVVVSFKIRIHIISESLLALIRMVIQLFLLGLYLEYLIKLNNLFLTAVYFAIMVAVTAFTIAGHAELKSRKIYVLIFISVFIVNTVLIILANYTLIPAESSFLSRYLIPVSGMLLGNTLNGCIIAVRNFKKYAVENTSLYYFHRSLGMSDFKAAGLWIRTALEESIRPGIANMATIGLISLPGMMTGQILAGQSPMAAITYQLAIMFLIFVSRFFSAYGTLFLLSKFYGTDRLISNAK